MEEVNLNDQPNIQTDGLTLSRAVDSLEHREYTGQFRTKSEGFVQCLECKAAAPAYQVAVDKMVRVEGVSDPADNSMVVAVQCRECHRKGTLILAYGPRATAEDAAVLESLNRGERQYPKKRHL